jgi:hypothetical protein
MVDQRNNQIPAWAVLAIGSDLARNIALAGWWTLLSLAVLCFVYIQRYLQDPQRQRLNDEWFAKFEANRQARYTQDGINWRAHDLREHFARPTSSCGMQGGPAGSMGPRMPLMY